MDIVFGLWADQGAWPDHGGDRQGALGAPVVGPNGFVELLETMLGLSGPASAHVVRIAAWQAHLEAADDGVRFWSASFAVDPWSTARLLLDWRDQLIEAGWDARRVYDQKRLADLAAAELVQPNIPAGIADRIARLVSSVEPDIARAIRRVRLVDRRVNHPIGWRRLIDRLEAAGIAIEEIEPGPAADATNALVLLCHKFRCPLAIRPVPQQGHRGR